MKWIFQKEDQKESAILLAKELSQKGTFPLSLSKLLIKKGINSLSKAKTFFRPNFEELHNPMDLPDMEIAIKTIHSSLKDNQKILIYGDYDVDGTTSVSLIKHYLDLLSANTEYYIPDRYQEGYGISFRGIDYARNNDFKVIIALDCGTKALDKIRLANEAGIKVIICDHHTPGPIYPDSIAFINPKRPDSDYPFKELSACGLGLKLIQALNDSFPEEERPLASVLDHYSDLVTLSIAADIVPMVGENRIIAFQGLKKIKKNPMPGIKRIMDKSETHRSWNISDLVFFIAPRINAVGRLGLATDVVPLLIGKKGKMDSTVLRLEADNSERRGIEQEITREALEMIDNDLSFSGKSGTVLYHDGWKKGIIGIVASRLIETHYKPTVILTYDDKKWVGSGRSVSGFNLYEALEKCSEHIVQFGGHKYAAGLTIKDTEIENFKNKFEQVVEEQITDEQKIPRITIDNELELDEIDESFLNILERFAPFGPENPRPVFATSSVRVHNPRVLKEKHIKFTVEKGQKRMEVIGFGLAEKFDSLNSSVIDIAYQPTYSYWNNQKTIQLRLKDIRK